MATIYIIKGNNNGEIYDVSEGSIRLGRSDACDVTLSDDRVSGTHLEISFDKALGCHVAEDTKSTNGTWFNGHSLVTPLQLKDGDRLEIGDSMVEYHSKSFDSIEKAEAARSVDPASVAPTLMDDKNRPF